MTNSPKFLISLRSTANCSHATLDGCTLSNRDLLAAFWYLAYTRNAGAPARRVNYAALDVEELGSVMKACWSPSRRGHDSAGLFHFALIFGSDRKTTGSFYTPPELVNELIESASCRGSPAPRRRCRR